MKRLFTSESVTEGHPDKICDQISDAVLDSILARDPMARVACETAVTTGMVLVMGEISTSCYVDIPKVVRNTIKEIGYDVSWNIINCDEYGVPQSRRRLVLLASKFGNIEMIKPSTSLMTVRDAIGKLPAIRDGEESAQDPLHRSSKLSPLNKQRIRQSKPGGTWLDWSESLLSNCHRKKSGQSYKAVYGRMEWNKPSPTITTQYTNFGSGRFGHPEQDRALSIREGAILQSFPITYVFERPNEKGKNGDLCRHIGNAVPVELGRAIGRSILNHLQNRV